jgi:hypothetical protein
MLDDVLSTPPVITEPCPGPAEPPAALGVHILCCQGDWLQALWSLKSFYYFSGAPYPLTVHVQGACPPSVLDRLAEHFPSARIISQEEADALAEAHLGGRGLERLRLARRADPLLMRLVDFPLFARSSRLLSFDPDVLFFRRPGELLAAPDAGPVPFVAQRDCHCSYTLTPPRALADLGVFLVPRLNCGIVLEPASAADLARCDEYLRHPALAAAHWHREQTLRALCACARGPVRYLPRSYHLGPGAHAHPGQLVARHYATPYRTLYSSEGLPTLRNLGLLDWSGEPAARVG